MPQKEIERLMKTRSITSEDFEKYIKAGFPDFGFEESLTYELRNFNDGQNVHDAWNLVQDYVCGS